MSGTPTAAEAIAQWFAGFLEGIDLDSTRFDTRYLAGELMNSLWEADRYTIVQLPSRQVIPTGWGDDCLGAWPAGKSVSDPVSAWPKGEVADPDANFMPAEQARALGLALLAAADVAEDPWAVVVGETPKTAKEQQK